MAENMEYDNDVQVIEETQGLHASDAVELIEETQGFHASDAEQVTPETQGLDTNVVHKTSDMACETGTYKIM